MSKLTKVSVHEIRREEDAAVRSGICIDESVAAIGIVLDVHCPLRWLYGLPFNVHTKQLALRKPQVGHPSLEGAYALLSIGSANAYEDAR